MKKTGMFLAVLLVASLFASGFALAESFALTGKAIGLDSNSGASIYAEELVPSSLSSFDVKESITNVDDSIGKKPAFPGHTTIGNGWIVTDDERTAFVHGVWTERKTSDGELVSFGKLGVGAKNYKLGKVGGWDDKSLRFAVHGAKGVNGKFSLDLTEQIGHMKFWEGTFSFDGTTGEVTLASKAHKIRKPTLGSGSYTKTRPTSVSDKPLRPEISVDDSGKLGISASDGKSAETEKKGLWKRFRDFFKRK